MQTRMGMQHEQQMLMQPRMLQSIQVLQLPTQELAEYLLDAAASNEALSLDESGEPPSEGFRRGTRADSDAHDQMLRNQPERDKSLAALVEEQLATSDLSGSERDWTRFLIGCLDERGYLSVPDERLLELAGEAGLNPDPGQLIQAIATLQTFEPRGIGARDAIEALLLQLDPEDENYEKLCQLLEHFVEDLAKNRLPSVARALGIELDELQGLIAELRDLSPRPAAELSQQVAPTLTPEVLVEKTSEGWLVRVQTGGVPAVRLDESVQTLARDREQPSAVRRYLRDKIDRARWIVEAVQQRGETLQRVAQTVFAHQQAFLEEGPGHLRPLQMNDTADWLGLHVSTVSRAVAGKYAQTPWGIFPLRKFFQTEAGGAGRARDDVRASVQAVVDAEDAARPLSDDEIVAELARRGLQVARRTVAKYRRELGIPSSYRRRKFE